MKRTYKILGTEISNSTRGTESSNVVSDIDGYTLERVVYPAMAQRGESEVVEIEMDDDDIAFLKFQDESEWIGRCGDLKQIFEDNENRGSDSSDELIIGGLIPQHAADRGWLKKAVVKAIGFFKPKDKIKDKLGTLAAQKVVQLAAKKFDEKVQPNPGLYYLDQNFAKNKVQGKLEMTSSPFLLFLHGTASSLEGSFGDLAHSSSNGFWEFATQNYQGRIIGLEHRTLTENPIENVTTLVKYLQSKSTFTWYHIAAADFWVNCCLCSIKITPLKGLTPQYESRWWMNMALRRLKRWNENFQQEKYTWSALCE